MSIETRRPIYKIGLIVVAIITLLYSVLIAGSPLLWVGLASSALTFYLVWRAVRALERIALATERLEAQRQDGDEGWER